MLLFTSQSTTAQGRGGGGSQGAGSQGSGSEGTEVSSLNNLKSFTITEAIERSASSESNKDETDSAELPLEKGKVKTVQPDANGRIPAGNCCTPVSRKKEAKPFTKASAQSFIDAYNQLWESGMHFVADQIPSKFDGYPS